MSEKIFFTIVRCFSVAMFLLWGTVAFAVTDDYTNYWPMDEGDGRSVNDLVGGQNGVLLGSSTGFGWASGQSGTAIGMDGMSGESIAFPNGMLKGSQGTLSLWFKMNSLSERNILFSGKSDANDNVYVAVSVDRDGRPQLQFRNTPSGADRRAQGMTLLNVNEWYNLVFIANGQNYRMYVNGEEIGVAGTNIGQWFSDVVGDTLMYRAGALDALPLSGVLDGYLDEIRVYGRALEGDDVKKVYEETNSATSKVPLAIRPELSFSISNDDIPYGGSVLLKWSSRNVSSCTASGDWIGHADVSGSKVFIKLGSSASYTLFCKGKGGIVSETVRVNVREKDEPEKGEVSVDTGAKKGILTVTPEPIVGDTAMSDTAAKETETEIIARIQSLIEQVRILIFQLQEQLEEMKKQSASRA